MNFRKIQDKVSTTWMMIALMVILLLPVAIIIGLVLKSLPILQQENIGTLLFSDEWQPMRGKFGFLPFILSSVVVSVLGLLIMIPMGLLPAIYLTQFAPPKVLRVLRSVIDILAGIPSVIHGVWGVLVVVPFVSGFLAPLFGVNSAGYTIMAGGIVLAVSVIPFVLHMLLEVFRSIPVELKEATLSLGATYWETIKKVVLKKSMPGIIAAYSLGVSKAFGETIAVLMVVGNVVHLPKGLFQPGYPLPALIANNYGEMLSIPMYDSALLFAAFLLFAVVLIFNIVSRMFIVKTTTI
jgi:phosphate transport system permease protein